MKHTENDEREKKWSTCTARTPTQKNIHLPYVQKQVHITQSKDVLNILCGVQTVLLDFTTNKFVYIPFRVYVFRISCVLRWE